ncbi:MAG: VWA domain-containing protein [Parcubacteria group bacterium]|nr:VWA domain-containing protein [Parcubacteria group bacterium]
MRFEYPRVFVLLLPLCLLVWLLRQRVSTRYSFVALVKQFDVFRMFSMIFKVFLCVVLVGLILALARPKMSGGFRYVMTRARDTIILLDKSGSMDSPFVSDPYSRVDPKYEETQYAIARFLTSKFVELRREDRISVCVFYHYVYCLLPLSYGHDALIEWLSVVDKAGGGTELALALEFSLNHFKERGQAGERAVIVVSDGDAVWGPEIEASVRALLGETGARISWVFIASADLVRSQDRWAPSQKALFRLVKDTGGEMFLVSSERQFQAAFDAVAKLQSKLVLVKLPAPETDFYPRVIAVTLLVAVIGMMLYAILVR